jgi:uncharacterized membrane protein YbhN (UPF0104 family)
MPSARLKRNRTLRVVRALLFPAILVGVFFGALPHLADMEAVWRVIADMSPAEVAVLVALTLLNVVTYWPVLMAGMPGLTPGRAALVNQSSTSVAMTLPGGGAIAIGVSYSMYTSWGFSASDVGLVTISTGIANFAVKLALPLAAVALVMARGESVEGWLSGAVIGIGILAGAAAVVAFVLRDERTARWMGRMMGRAARLGGSGSAWDDAAGRFRGSLVALLRRRWAPLAVATVISQLAVYSVLLAALRFVGVPDREIGWDQALAVFALVRLASAVPLIPGNVGLAELGYIGGLLLVGGDRTHVVAAVLLFRFLTYFVQIPLGGVTYLLWRRGLPGGGARTRSTSDQEERPDGDGAAPGDGGGEQGDLGMPGHGTERQHERPSVPAT